MALCHDHINYGPLCHRAPERRGSDTAGLRAVVILIMLAVILTIWPEIGEAISGVLQTILG